MIDIPGFLRNPGIVFRLRAAARQPGTRYTQVPAEPGYTNIALHAMEGHDHVLDRLSEHDGAIVISVLSAAELQRGVHKRGLHTAIRKTRMDVLLRNIPILPFDNSAAEAYERIIAQCGWIKGRDFDRMIAAHAIASHSVLVTANVADFRDIPGLMLENWVL